MAHERCKETHATKLQPESHRNLHSKLPSIRPKPLILLTKRDTYDPPTGSGKGSGKRRGATHREPAGFQTPAGVPASTPAEPGRSPPNLPCRKANSAAVGGAAACSRRPVLRLFMSCLPVSSHARPSHATDDPTTPNRAAAVLRRQVRPLPARERLTSERRQPRVVLPHQPSNRPRP